MRLAVNMRLARNEQGREEVVLRFRVLLDSLEHPPCIVLQGGVAGDAVEDEQRLDCFGSIWHQLGQTAIISAERGHTSAHISYRQ